MTPPWRFGERLLPAGALAVMPPLPRPHPLALAAFAGPTGFALAAIAAAAAQPRYDSRREDISALAAVDARAAWIMAAGIVLLGVATLAVAAALAAGWSSRPGGRAAGAALALAGLATAAAGAMPIDCSERVDAACRAHIEAGLASWHDQGHNIAIALAALAFSVAPLLLALAPGWSDLSRYSALTAAATLVLYAVYLAEPAPSWSGVLQRLLVAVPLVWMAVVAARVAPRARPSELPAAARIAVGTPPPAGDAGGGRG